MSFNFLGLIEVILLLVESIVLVYLFKHTLALERHEKALERHEEKLEKVVVEMRGYITKKTKSQALAKKSKIN